MNPFSVGDRVQYPKKGRRNGYVNCIFCGECDRCKAKDHNACTADFINRSKVKVSFPDVFTQDEKVYLYDYLELSFETDFSTATKQSIITPPPKVEAQAPEERSFDLCSPDIRKIGAAELDVPLIVPEDGWSELEIEVDSEVDSTPNPISETAKTSTKTLEKNDDDSDIDEGIFEYGMCYDQYIALVSKIGCPI